MWGVIYISRAFSRFKFLRAHWRVNKNCLYLRKQEGKILLFRQVKATVRSWRSKSLRNLSFPLFIRSKKKKKRKAFRSIRTHSTGLQPGVMRFDILTFQDYDLSLMECSLRTLVAEVPGSLKPQHRDRRSRWSWRTARSPGRDPPVRRIGFTCATWTTSRVVSVNRPCNRPAAGYAAPRPTAPWFATTSPGRTRPASAEDAPAGSRLIVASTSINRSSFWTAAPRKPPLRVGADRVAPTGVAMSRYRSHGEDPEHRPDGCRHGTTIRIRFRRISARESSLNVYESSKHEAAGVTPAELRLSLYLLREDRLITGG